MNTEMAVKLKGLARLIGGLVAIELFLPGGTLIALGYLLALRPHVRASAEGERAVRTWHGIGGSCPRTRVTAVRAGQRTTIACRTFRGPAAG